MKLTFIFSICLLQYSAFCADQTIDDWLNLKKEGAKEVSENVNLIFTPDPYHVIQLQMKNLPFLMTEESFNMTKPTVFYFHGWLESGKLDLSCLAVRGAYMDRGDHNVVTVDWSKYSKNINYEPGVIPQMQVIAETFSEYLRDFINNGYGVENIHLVGHSLGGQMVGKIARHLKKISNSQLEIPRIYALDPAGPGFEDHSILGMQPISRTDAKYVQIIHTCAGKLGMQYRVGTIDFFPDGGSRHPGCNVDVTTSLYELARYACDHARSWHFYQLTVRNPKAFPAIRCNSYDDFLNMHNDGKCFEKDIAFMGFGADPTATGKYFFQTNANMFNLTRGIDGISPRKTNITAFQPPTSRVGESVSVPLVIAESDFF